MSLSLKICGLRDERELPAILDAQPDAVGVICGTLYRREDAVSPDVAQRLLAAVPTDALRVLVTHLPAADAVILAQRTGAQALQLHAHSTPEQLRCARERAPGLQLIAAIDLSHPSPEGEVWALDGLADYLLLDAHQALDVQLLWQRAQACTQIRRQTPILLGGGLNAANVADVVALVAPDGIDVNSGIENEAGLKDPARARQFAARARAALITSGRQRPCMDLAPVAAAATS